MVIAGVLLLGRVVLTLVLLTVAGERQRGGGVLLAAVAGLCFPVTWAVWYVRHRGPPLTMAC